MVVAATKSLARPHNCYNIYFILERQKLIDQARKDSSDGTAARVSDEKVTASSVDLAGYDSLSLPDLPQRYKGITLEHGWFVPGKNANRKHVKTHGLTSFSDMARTVASNWKVADSETKTYCNTVARIIKERHAMLMRVRGIGSTAKKGPKKKSQTISMKKHQQLQNGWRRASDPPMPSNMVMANIPNRENLHLSSSTCVRSSASVAHSGNMLYPNIFSVTPEQQARASMANVVMADIPLHRSSSIGGRPSPSVAYGGMIHPNLFSVTPDQTFYNYLSSIDNIRQMNSRNQENTSRSSSMVDLPSAFDLAMGLESPNDAVASLMGVPDIACPAMIQEVDISDSDIRDMWRSDSV